MVLCLVCLTLWPTRGRPPDQCQVCTHTGYTDEWALTQQRYMPTSRPLSSRNTNCFVSAAIFVGFFEYFDTFYPHRQMKVPLATMRSRAFLNLTPLPGRWAPSGFRKEQRSLIVVFIMLQLSGYVLNYRKDEENKENRQCNKYCKRWSLKYRA